MAEDCVQAAPLQAWRQTTREQVESFLLDELMFGAERSDLSSGVRLVSDGMMDSMAVLRLVYFLEETFGVTIPPDQMTGDNFDSVDLILACIERNRASASERSSP